MPTYLFRCPEDHEFTEWFSIRADSLTATCECGRAAPKVMVAPRISVYATPSKGEDARAVDAREARWQRDMPAYRALRRDGYQPPRIDGCHALQRDAVDRMEIEAGFKFRSKDDLTKAREAQQSLEESDREGTFATEMGKALPRENRRSDGS